MHHLSFVSIEVMHMRYFWAVLCITLLFCVSCGSGNGQQTGEARKAPVERTVISVAAAADLKFALDEIAGEFQKKEPDKEVRITYGSSGNFFAQLTNKAPFDIFFSADIAYPNELVTKNLAMPDTIFSYAWGKMVVWVPNSSTIHVETDGIQALLNPAIRKIAIANPNHAPYGRAAVSALKKLGLYEKIQDKLVLGENIAQTALFIESGAADIGIIAISLAIAPTMKDKGRYWSIPEDAYPKMEQGGVIMSWAKSVPATKSFKEFVISAQGKAVLRKYGFYFEE